MNVIKGVCSNPLPCLCPWKLAHFTNAAPVILEIVDYAELGSAPPHAPGVEIFLPISQPQCRSLALSGDLRRGQSP